jgi:hypothetical protein
MKEAEILRPSPQPLPPQTGGFKIISLSTNPAAYLLKESARDAQRRFRETFQDYVTFSCGW